MNGQSASGPDQIRHWLTTAASEYTYERTLLEFSSLGPDEWLIVNNVTGNFPGGTVHRVYRFRLHEDRIQQLTIAP